MSILINSKLHQAEPGQSQRTVDAYFQGRSSYWRNVYQEDNNSFMPSFLRDRRAVVLAMVDRLGLRERSRVLEFGCGAGLTAVALAKRGYTVDAVDTVEAMLNLTRQAALEAGVKGLVKTTLGSAQEMNFRSQHFDLVVAVGVLPWLEHPAKALLETKRVLKPGGHVIVTSSNRWCLNRMADPLRFPGVRTVRWKIEDTLERLKLLSRSVPRYHNYSIKQFDDILCQTGFRKVHGMTIGFGPFTFLSRRLLTDHFGIKLHRSLQELADRQFPGIRSAGFEYAVVAVRAT